MPRPKSAQHRPSGLASLPDCFFLDRFAMGTLGDFSPGSLHSRTVAGAPCSSRRSASLLRPQGALGFGPPKPLAWDRSLPPAVRETGRRSVGNRKECRLRHDYASFPGPQTPSSLRAYSSFLSVKTGAALPQLPFVVRIRRGTFPACRSSPSACRRSGCNGESLRRHAIHRVQHGRSAPP